MKLSIKIPYVLRGLMNSSSPEERSDDFVFFREQDLIGLYQILLS